jgi:hypothetical protein
MNWGAMSRAERDAAYNNPAAVPESAVLLAAWREASAAFRAAHADHLDQRYGPRERNTWDLFPAANPKAPCLVFIHGGYWQRNSKDMFTNLIAGPCAMGWAAALPGTRWRPTQRWSRSPRKSTRRWTGSRNTARRMALPVLSSCPAGPPAVI